MNRLKYSRCYLCGPMDLASDNGVGWRKNIQNELKDLEIVWLDPTNKPSDVGQEGPEIRAQLKVWKQQHQYDAVREVVKILRSVDLRLVDLADELVVHIDLTIPMCGTMEELFLANREMKPIIIHVEQGKENCPNWLFATVPHQFIFSTWQGVYAYLRHINASPIIEAHKRWYFFDYSQKGIT